MEKTLTALASDLLARLPIMTDEEKRLGLEIYRELAHGEPVVRAALADALEVPTRMVDDLLEHPNLSAPGTVSSSPTSLAWRPTWNRLRLEAPLPFG